MLGGLAGESVVISAWGIDGDYHDHRHSLCHRGNA